MGNIITNQNTPFDKEIAGQGVRRCCCHCRAEKKKVRSEQLPVISTLHEEYFKTKAEKKICCRLHVNRGDQYSQELLEKAAKVNLLFTYFAHKKFCALAIK